MAKFWQKYKEKKVVIEAIRNTTRVSWDYEMPASEGRSSFVLVPVGSYVIKSTGQVLTHEEFTSRYCPLESSR